MKKIMITLVVVLGLVSSALAHEHHPPHKGTLVVLGKEFAHLELVLDSDTGTLTAYSLDGEAENAVFLTQTEIDLTVSPLAGTSFDVALKAVENSLTGETVGSTSQFTGKADFLQGINKFSGTIVEITTRGQTFKDVAFNFPEGNDHD